MSFWRKIAGLAVRNLDEADCPICPPGLPGEDPAFTTAVTALGAKLAKADGRVSREEVAAFREVFHVPPDEVKNVARVFDQAKRSTAGFEAYARQIAYMFSNRPAVLEELLDALFHIAKADGGVEAGELAYLREVARIRDWIVMEAPTGHRFCLVKPQSDAFPGDAPEWGA